MTSAPGITVELRGQMTVWDCIAEAERALAKAVQTPPPLSYVEPCPDCAAGDHQFCDGKTLDHALDEFVPCPCRCAGHPPEEFP